MVDALMPAVSAAETAAAEDGGDVAAVLTAAADAADRGAESTVDLVPRKGRASYLGERAVGHLDPGARSTALLLRAFAEAARMSRVGHRCWLSHSAKLAEGVAELAAQMAPDVTVAARRRPVRRRIGTDYDAVVAAAQRADSGDGVVLLYDLGSAQMTAELAVESLADPSAAVVADAPLVEGAIAAAVAAQARADRKRGGARPPRRPGCPRTWPPPRPRPAGTRSSWNCTTKSACTRGRPRCWCATLSEFDAEVSVRLGEQEADAQERAGADVAGRPPGRPDPRCRHAGRRRPPR